MSDSSTELLQIAESMEQFAARSQQDVIQRRSATKRHRGGDGSRRQQTLDPEDPADQRTDRSTVRTSLTASKQAGLTAGPAHRASPANTRLPHSPVADARLYGPRSRPINVLRGIWQDHFTLRFDLDSRA